MHGESVETIPFTINFNLSLSDGAASLFRSCLRRDDCSTLSLSYETQPTKPCRRRQACAESPYPVVFLLQAQRAPSLFGDQAPQPRSYRAL